MVTRTSQEAQFNVGNPVQVTGTRTGYVAPDVAKYAESSSVDTPRIGPSSTDRVLGAILSVTGKLAEQAVQVSREEAYLAGSAAAISGKAESELNSNIFTKNWSTAGFRDTAGRMKAADIDADIQQSMVAMREQSPEEFQTYLAGKRKELMGSFEGMSRQQRGAMFQQAMLSDRSYIKKHAAEHYKFIIETENKSVRASIYTANANMNTAKMESPNGSAVEVYNAAVDSAYGVANASILNNPKLPTDTKAKLIGEFAQSALQSDNYALFLKMQNTGVALPDGRTAPMLSMLTQEDQNQLSGMYRESLKRTEGLRNLQYNGELVQMQASWESSSTPPQSEKSVLQFLEEGVRTGALSEGTYRSTYENFLKQMEKKTTSGALANAFVTGDQQAMLALGKTRTEGLKAWITTNAPRMTQAQIVDQLFVIGSTTQQEEAFKEVGYILAPAFAQLGNRDTMDPQAAAGIAQTLQRLDAAEQNGMQGAYASFLSAFSPEVQSKIGYIRDNLKMRADPVSAITSATARVLDESKMDPAMRTAIAQAKAGDVVKAVQDIQPRDLWDTAILGVKSVVSKDAAALLDLTVRQRWGESSLSSNSMLQQSRLEYSKALDAISKRNPSMNINEVRSLALADVKGRTLNMEWGPLVVPQGSTPQAYFGTDRSTPNDRIASAITEYLKPAAGNRVNFTFGVSGELVVQEMNQDGQAVKAAFLLDPKQIPKLVQAQQMKLNGNYQQNFGAGKVVQVGGVDMRYNGDNSANVENPSMVQFRDSLVSLGALDSISTGPIDAKVPKAVSDAARNQAFLEVSNDAAKIAKRVMTSTRLQSSAALQFFGALAYQAGADLTKRPPYKSLLGAIAARDSQAAVTALHGTPAYIAADEGARKFYDEQLQNTLKGN